MFNVRKINNLKIFYIFIFIISSFEIYNISITTINTTWFLVLLFKYNILIIIYFFVFLLGYIVLFTEIFNNISKSKKLTIITLALIIILTICLTFLGNLPSINNNIDYAEALNIWINHFFSLQYPYAYLTHLEGRITPLPFLPLYSIPFYLVGNVAYQNFISLLIIIYILWKFCDDIYQLNFGLISLLLSIPYSFVLLTHSYHITTAAFTILALYLLYKNRFELGSLIFGFLISSAAYIWPLIPSIIYYMISKKSIKNSYKSILILLITPIIIILPFILWNPQIFFNFAPIGEVSNRLSAFKNFNIIFTLILTSISLTSYIKTKNIFFAVFISLIIFELVLPLRSTYLLALTTIFLGIYNNKNQLQNQN